MCVYYAASHLVREESITIRLMVCSSAAAANADAAAGGKELNGKVGLRGFVPNLCCGVRERKPTAGDCVFAKF